MTSLVLLPLAGMAALAVLVAALSTVYVCSGDGDRRTRAWHVLRALLDAVGHGRADDA
ncbi:hypothetical protein AB0L33_34470 [Streptomyces sp. NPDC052299]|uniref:hypothetical protein n=1 Tax=Streptomyces sp. NPDC052299 TaxID=3155054 RepID=UPI00341597A3